MLGKLEAKLAAIVSDHVAARTHLTVGIAPAGPPAAGKGVVTLALAEITPQTGFSPLDTDMVEGTGASRSRRVLPVGFRAVFDFRAKPAGNSPPARTAARTLLLEDMSAVAFLLADPSLQTGAAFAVAAADPGFRVLRFGIVAGTTVPGAADDGLSGQLVAQGEAQVWPVGVQRDEGVIEAIDRVIAPLPVTIQVAPPVVRPDKETRVTCDLGPLARLDAATGAPAPIELAVTVLADVPAAQRGTVPNSLAGTEAGVRIVPAGQPRVEIRYRAPAGDPGPDGRIEYLAVHLATPERAKGLYLGSAAIRLAAAP